MKFLLSFVFLLTFCAASFAQKGADLNRVQTKSYTGIIKEKPWTKSTESYCMGGSEYYVLVNNDQTEYLLKSENVDFSRFKGRKVTIVGTWQTKTIQNDDNGSSMEQRPVSTFPTKGGQTVSVVTTCEIFYVTAIR